MGRRYKQDDFDTNGNTNAIETFAFKIYYIVSLVGASLFVHCFFEWDTAWTMINLIHTIVSLLGLHWFKGSPISEAQGKYNRFTFWEQLSKHETFTRTQKFLFIVPVVLFIVCIHMIEHRSLLAYIINCACLAVALVAKLPQMYLVRIMGINQ
eukprot:GILI01005784.1.p1 GENE.GILI01005784.1~~GILI01005784.1.p1  ORF type:complete len:153 (-),score=42.43 GILI01005784.1:607-1065(-)